MRQLKRWGVSLGIVLVFLFVGGLLEEPLSPLTSLMERHQQALLMVIGTLTALGLVAFLGGLTYLMLRPPLVDSGSTAPSPARSALSGGRLRASASVDVDIPMRDLKQALRTGAWSQDPLWRIYIIIMVGAMTMAIGIVGILVVLAPLPVKLLLAAALLYAAIRIALGFAQA